MAPPAPNQTLEDVLGSLSLGEREEGESNVLFKSELSKSGFSIFTPISDLGYFAWQPSGSYKRLSNITSKEEIIDNLKLTEKPKQLVPSSSLRLPQTFKSLPPQEHENRFPYGQFDIACLHVATQHRGVNMDDVDFAFGGSTLEMLARKDVSAPYMVTRVPSGTTNTILVVKCKDYVQNYADFGFQFERLVTGMSILERPNVEFIEHLHLLQVGSYRVLFRAEVDAMQDGEPVEVKASNPRYWGTKVMFQMISSGSFNLCHGVKARGALTRVNLIRLSEVSRDAFYEERRDVLEKNILVAMASLKAEMAEAKDGEVFKVTFSGGSLRLLPATTRNAVLLPPANIVKDLLS
jgi:hypothetical protein